MEAKKLTTRSTPYLRITGCLLLLAALIIGGVAGGMRLTRAASSEPELYQLRTDGSIWAYTGTDWQQLGPANSLADNIVAAPGNLFQLRSDGSIWRYTGTPLTGWQQYDTANGAKTISESIAGKIYQLRSATSATSTTLVFLNDGRYAGWKQLDTHPASLIAGPEVLPQGATGRGIVPAPSTSGVCYEIRNDGVWLFYETAWQQIDTSIVNGSSPAIDIKATLDRKIYQLRGDPTSGNSIWMYTGGTSWQRIDNAQNAQAIRVDGNSTLYQLDHNGTIWSYNGSGWIALPSNPTSSQVINFKVSKSGDVFEILQNRSVWAYKAGVWQQIDNNPTTAIITTDAGDTAGNTAG